MDYLASPWLFRARKALRYVRLYGPARTMVKIAGQYHMRRRYDTLPPSERRAPPTAHVGLLGCGNFAFTVVADVLRRRYGAVIRGCMDVDANHAASLYERCGAAYYTTDSTRIIEDPNIDTIYIASNHASHAPYAAQALRAGKDVHIEKPHVVRNEQLDLLVDAMAFGGGRVMSIGYNRSRSLLGRRIYESLERESGQSMQSWFIAGHALPEDHWYYSDEEGGRVLGNLCHWIEFVYQAVPHESRFPVRIVPTRSQRSDCDIAVTYTFADGSIAALTFSAKGRAFEGVKERYAAHRGDTLIALDDFQFLRIDTGEHVVRTRLWTRDHGHEASILGSYTLSRNKNAVGCSAAYIFEVGRLILATREALENGTEITVKGAGELPTATATAT